MNADLREAVDLIVRLNQEVSHNLLYLFCKGECRRCDLKREAIQFIHKHTGLAVMGEKMDPKRQKGKK